MEPGGSQNCPGSCLAFSRTRKGLVLIAEIILCLLTLICFGASRSGYAGLAAVEMVFAALVLLAWGCRLPPRLPWGWTDFTRCVIGAVLFLITSLIVIVDHRGGAAIAGGVFGLLAGILLGYDAYITLPTRQGHSAAPTESPDGA
ncbi:proteolipid protein 2-like [Manacus candei]|uniref:proteolipid protein 2-like n=1 Tax=Manacus candei TaxID=415023 RepID=UPI002226C568|nr:proteolipid protein 2-like [Manacus candei]